MPVSDVDLGALALPENAGATATRRAMTDMIRERECMVWVFYTTFTPSCQSLCR